MRWLTCFSAFLIVFWASQLVLAQDSPTSEPESYRYGPFNLLDRRSTYGKFWFPEPLSADEMDVDRELRLDYFHGENQDTQESELVAEVEWNFGLVTLELAVPYSRESESTFEPIEGRTLHEKSDGIGNIELAIRAPIFQYVDPQQRFDYTLAAGFELALPSGSKISKDTELVPALFNLLRIGEHFSIQSGIGYS